MYAHASITDSELSHYFTVPVDNLGSNKYKVAPTKPTPGQTISVYHDTFAILYTGMKLSISPSFRRNIIRSISEVMSWQINLHT